MNNCVIDLQDYMARKRVISTHSHHNEDRNYQYLDLDSILINSYVNWCGVQFDNTSESRRSFLEKVRYNSYFVWLEKSIREIYSIDGPITADNWDIVSSQIRSANSRDNHLRIFKDICRYEKIVLDAYWNPGFNNGHPDLFTPTFRINMFLYGYGREDKDHNGNNPQAIFGTDIGSMDEYVDFMYNTIARKKQEGCVALKSALAYDRGLDFTAVSKAAAQKAFDGKPGRVRPEDAKAFGDYVFFEICKIAARLDLPLQCHTGLGRMDKTNALQMLEVIQKNPDTKFVLFHGGYPWMDDIYGLTHNFSNVYPDLCWLPLISTSAAARMLEELIEVSTIEKICWGCDTWTSEESYGALLAVKEVLAKVLSAKVENGYLSKADAEMVIDRILYDNAKELYRLK